jgi:hypothetical protein
MGCDGNQDNIGNVEAFKNSKIIVPILSAITPDLISLRPGAVDSADTVGHALTDLPIVHNPVRLVWPL